MQRYFSNQLCNDEFLLNADDMYHIHTVMRMQDEDLVEVVYGQALYLAKLVHHKVIKIREQPIKNHKKKQYILCLPLLTDNKMSFVLQKATELGIDKIIPIETKRSVVKLDKNKLDKKLERWYKICKEASEQAKRITIPIITEVKSLEQLQLDGLKIVCSTTSKEHTLKDVLMSDVDTITFAIGPEGGFEPKEEELLQHLGFLPVTLGDNIMRVETVPIFILSILKYEE